MLLFAMLLSKPLLENFITVTTILRSFELGCYIVVFYYLHKLHKANSLRNLRSYEKFLYVLLFLVTLSILLRGEWPRNPKDFALHLLATPTYSLPFIVALLPNARHFESIIKIFYAASLFVIPIWLINASQLVQVGTHLAEGIGIYLPFMSAFLLGVGCCFDKRQKRINIIIWSVYFLLMMLNARRNVSFSLFVYAFIAYMFSFSNMLKKNKAKFVVMSFASLFAGIVLLLNLQALSSGLFKNMAGRIGQDSRSGVEEFFFADFAKAPMSDWMFGRGMDGGYAQVVVSEATGEVSDIRPVIETGYLHIMLKGGLVYDALIILLMLLALKRGCSKKDKLSKYISVILLTYFVDLYTTNPVCSFSVRSILFWFCIGVASSKSQWQVDGLITLDMCKNNFVEDKKNIKN